MVRTSKHQNTDFLNQATKAFIAGNAHVASCAYSHRFDVSTFCEQLQNQIYNTCGVDGLFNGAQATLQRNSVELVMNHTFGANNTLDILKQSAKAIKIATSWIQCLDKDKMSDYEKSKWIYEKLIQSVEYADEAILSDTSIPELDKFFASNYYGVFLKKRATCRGISEAVRLLAVSLDLKCEVILGDGKNENGWGKHAWNLILLGGNLYHLDATFDVKTYKSSNVFCYTHFNLCDDAIKVNHAWNTAETPPCNAQEYNY